MYTERSTLKDEGNGGKFSLCVIISIRLFRGEGKLGKSHVRVFLFVFFFHFNTIEDSNLYDYGITASNMSLRTLIHFRKWNYLYTI